MNHNEAYDTRDKTYLFNVTYIWHMTFLEYWVLKTGAKFSDHRKLKEYYNVSISLSKKIITGSNVIMTYQTKEFFTSNNKNIKTLPQNAFINNRIFLLFLLQAWRCPEDAPSLYFFLFFQYGIALQIPGQR